MKNIYNIKKTISIKQFISEFGEDFSKHIKKRLLDLEVRTVLNRKEDNNRLDIKHVEHIKYDIGKEQNVHMCTGKKEYVYGQFSMDEGILYFSENCLEDDNVIESPVISTIFNNLDAANMITKDGISGKKIDDSNIDYVIDSILEVCPDVSQEYKDIVSGMTYRANKKDNSNYYGRTY